MDDPLAPFASAPAPTEKLPPGIWIFAGIYLMNSVLALSSYFLLVSGIFPTAHGQTGRELLEGMGPLDHLQTVGLGMLQLVAGVALLLRMRFVVWLFSIDFAIAVALISQHYLIGGVQPPDSTASIAFGIWALLASAGACAYSWYLRYLGFLR